MFYPAHCVQQSVHKSWTNFSLFFLARTMDMDWMTEWLMDKGRQRWDLGPANWVWANIQASRWEGHLRSVIGQMKVKPFLHQAMKIDWILHWWSSPIVHISISAAFRNPNIQSCQIGKNLLHTYSSKDLTDAVHRQHTRNGWSSPFEVKVMTSQVN